MSRSLFYDINVGSIIVFTRLCSSSSVIEVASGEYGDLNPVLFDAVQGGLCSEESKKNSRDKSDSSCPSQYYSVSDLGTPPLGLVPHLYLGGCIGYVEMGAASVSACVQVMKASGSI